MIELSDRSPQSAVSARSFCPPGTKALLRAACFFFCVVVGVPSPPPPSRHVRRISGLRPNQQVCGGAPDMFVIIGWLAGAHGPRECRASFCWLSVRSMMMDLASLRPAGGLLLLLRMRAN